jgi:hypothetical protein
MSGRAWRRGKAAAVAFLAVVVVTGDLPAADEGMWTFANPPLAQLKERYGFEPTKAWLDHLRLSSIRFNDGGSGSFVGPNGLALTNHHVAVGQLQKASTPKHDYVKSGFYAPTAGREIKCADLELNVLLSFEDVTARILGAVKPGMAPRDALTAREATRAALEKDSQQTTGLHSEVVTLYAGGEYWLYRYKRYTDVRLVFAPEQQAAFFGGDPDNFTYPRYDLDFALVRAYENGKPARTPHYLKWNPAGAREGELVFVSGHPGSTSRQNTVAQLEFERDLHLPTTLTELKRRLTFLRTYSSRGAEQARQAAEEIFGIENSIKALGGQLAGLQNTATMVRKADDEKTFRDRVAARAEWQQQYGRVWDDIAAVVRRQRELAPLGYRTIFGGDALTSRARQILRIVTEQAKPDGERLDGYHDSQLTQRRFYVLSPAPIHSEFEEASLADHLALALEAVGPNDEVIKATLDGRTPAAAAAALVGGTKLGDPAFRKSLLDGGLPVVTASTDPLIVLYRKIDPLLRRDIARIEAEIEAPLSTAGELLGQARFAAFGRTTYPDADFSLRLSYGAVKGYPMNGTQAPPVTTFYGLFDRSQSFGGKPPYDLTQKVAAARPRLSLSTPLNFVTTNDIIGGNSGSPIVNRAGELVGLVFDGNIESLVGNYVYDDTTNRTVAVHSAAILEALRAIYGAGALADEIQGRPAEKPKAAAGAR